MPRRRPQAHEYGHAAKRPTMDEILASRAELNRASADFLKTDVEAALTFSKIAGQTEAGVKRQRNVQNARKAYDTIVRMMKRVSLSARDSEILAIKLKQLRLDLVALGESL